MAMKFLSPNRVSPNIIHPFRAQKTRELVLTVKFSFVFFKLPKFFSYYDYHQKLKVSTAKDFDCISTDLMKKSVEF